MLAAAAIAVLPSVASAAPHDPTITVTLEAINDSVTLSRPASNPAEALITFAAYRLTVTNNAASALNRIFLNAVANNIGGTDPVVFDSVIGPSSECAGFGTTTLNCDTSISLAPRGGTTNFIVVVKSPATGTQIQIQWVAGGREGSGGGQGCCGTSGTATTNLIDATTNISFRENAQSFIKNTGGLLFTGDRWITKPADPITSFVEIPAGFFAPFALGQVHEQEVSGAPDCATQAHFLKCYESGINIPSVDFSNGGTVSPPSNFWRIVIRIDSSVIKRGTRIEDVLVRYVDDSTTVSPVPLCATTSPETYPCITIRKHYRNKSVEGWTKDLDGDYELQFKHFKNGSWTLF
jgi:hypothetical protein